MNDMAKTPKHGSELRKAVQAIGKWILKISTPEFQAFKREKMGRVLGHGEGVDLEGGPDFSFGAEIDAQHDLVSAWFNLVSAMESMRQSQHYLRRFPFKGLPITHADHARNVLEMYFSSVYALKERLKKFLNLLKTMYPDLPIDIGKTIKSFEKRFDSELRERNGVHHHAPYKDIGIERLTVVNLIASDPKVGKGWEIENKYFYGQFRRQWIKKIEARSVEVENFLDALSVEFLKIAAFLRTDEAAD